MQREQVVSILLSKQHLLNIQSPEEAIPLCNYAYLINGLDIFMFCALHRDKEKSSLKICPFKKLEN